MGPKAGKGTGKPSAPVEPEVEDEDSSQGEDIEEEEDLEGSEGEGEAMVMDEDDLEISEAVNTAVGAIATLSTPDAVRTALDEVKEQIKTLLYTSVVGSMFKAVLETDSPTKPFTESEKLPAQKLFSRCSVTSHGVFRDDEFTLGPRRDICGAATTIEIANKAEDAEVSISLVWYWRHDEEEGWVEEYELTMEEEADDVKMEEEPDEDEKEEKKQTKAKKETRAKQEDEDEDEDEDDDEDEGPEVDIITLLEGRRSQRGESSSTVHVEALRALDAAIESGLALQSLLRFLVLATRTECDKCQGKPPSIAEGFDEEEDAEQMRVYLCSVQVEGEGPDVGQSSSSKAADKKRKAAPGGGGGGGGGGGSSKLGTKKAKKKAK